MDNDKVLMRKRIYSNSKYQIRKDMGLCVRCGKKAPAENRVMCKECGEITKNYAREVREWCKENHICIYCHKAKAFGNYKSCAKCAEKNANSNRKFIDNKYGSNHEYYLQDIAKLKEKGICRGCRKNKVENGKTYCSGCLEKRRIRGRVDRNRKGMMPRSIRASLGLCYTCGAPIDRNGRSCSKCAERLVKNFKRSDNKNHCWRKDNMLISKR